MRVEHLSRPLVADENGVVVVDPAPARVFRVWAHKPGITEARLRTLHGTDPLAAKQDLGEFQLTGEEKVSAGSLVVSR